MTRTGTSLNRSSSGISSNSVGRLRSTRISRLNRLPAASNDTDIEVGTNERLNRPSPRRACSASSTSISTSQIRNRTSRIRDSTPSGPTSILSCPSGSEPVCGGESRSSSSDGMLEGVRLGRIFVGKYRRSGLTVHTAGATGDNACGQPWAPARLAAEYRKN